MNEDKRVSLEKFNLFLEQKPEYSAEDLAAFLQGRGMGFDADLQEMLSQAEQAAADPTRQEVPIVAEPATPLAEPGQPDLGAKSLSDFAFQRVPQSALQFGQDIGTVVAHPWQTAKGMGGLIASVSAKLKNKAVGNDSGKGEEIADAIGEMYANRYGSIESALDTAYYDPIGFLGDASLFITGIGSAVGGSAKAAQLLGRMPKLGVVGSAAGKISKAGKSVRRFGDAVDLPFRALHAVGEPVVKGAVKGGKTAFKMTPRLFQEAVLAPTRVPKWAARLSAIGLAKLMGTTPVAVDETIRIFRSKGIPQIIEEQRAWREGTQTADKVELLDMVRNAVEELRTGRGAEYSQTKSGLDLTNKTVNVEGLEQALERVQQEFDFDIDAPVGKRYQRSPLFGEPQGGHFSMTLDKVKAYLDGVRGRTDDGLYTPDDLNAREYDKLKMQIDNMMERMSTSADGTTSRSKAVLAELRAAIRNELSNVDGYDNMTRKYEEASELLQGMHETFDFKVMDKVKQDEALRKVIDILKTDREYGRQLLNRLEQQTQTPLFAQIVGSQFAEDLPEVVSPGMGLSRGRRGNDEAVAIALALSAPAAQPSFWGEALRAMGYGARAVDETVDILVRNRHRIIKIAKEREEAKRHQEQTDPGFQESKIDPILDKVTNPQQRSALQQIADQGIRANRDVDRLLESITRSPKY